MFSSLRQRRMRLLFAVALVACALALLRPFAARAGYPFASEARVALGFGATYRSADASSSSTHRGVDLAAEAGARVQAPLAGRVTFVGRVPGVGGGTVREVTIATAQGAVSLLPFASATVAKGDQLAEGDAVGTVADTGDGSSAGTHLHVGVKRGDLYVDPMGVLTLPAVAPGDGDGQGAGAGAGSQTGARAVAPASGAHASADHAGTISSAHASSRSTSRGTLRAPVAGTLLAPGVSVPGGAGAPAAPVAAGSLVSAGVPMLPAPAVHAPVLPSVPPLTLGELAARLGRLAASSVRVIALGLLGTLAGLGLLWPVWRREERKGTGEDRVSAIGEDVAAVVGQ
jgi:hypothetical protein